MIRFVKLWILKGRRAAVAIRDQELCTLMLTAPAPWISRPWLFIRDLVRTLSVRRLAPPTLTARRLAVCRRHPECYSNTPIPHCRRCGCTTLKLRLPTARCPRSLW